MWPGNVAMSKSEGDRKRAYPCKIDTDKFQTRDSPLAGLIRRALVPQLTGKLRSFRYRRSHPNHTISQKAHQF